MYKEKIVDELGNVTFRDYTEEEILEVENAKKESEKRIAELKEIDKKRKSALAKLAALGLTEDEIAAL